MARIASGHQSILRAGTIVAKPLATSRTDGDIARNDRYAGRHSLQDRQSKAFVKAECRSGSLRRRTARASRSRCALRIGITAPVAFSSAMAHFGSIFSQPDRPTTTIGRFGGLRTPAPGLQQRGVVLPGLDRANRQHVILRQSKLNRPRPSEWRASKNRLSAALGMTTTRSGGMLYRSTTSIRVVRDTTAIRSARRIFRGTTCLQKMQQSGRIGLGNDLEGQIVHRDHATLSIALPAG